MAKLDELIEELRGDGRDEDAEELEKLRGSTLREKAKKADSMEKENVDLKARLDKLEKAPKIAKAFTDYGIDFENLSKLERKAIESYEGDLDEEAIGKFVEENELVIPEASKAEEEPEAPAAERVAQAARTATRTKGGKAPTVTGETVAGWSMDKKVAFAEEHPTEWEALKRGETVVVAA